MLAMRLRKYFVVASLALAIQTTRAQDAVAEAKHGSRESEWNDSNRADVSKGEVSLQKRVIFKVERSGNTAYIYLPQKAKFYESKLWIFEVKFQDESSSANWDSKKKAWRFTIMGRGQHIIYASKRKNNIQSIPYTWFVLSV